MQSSVLHAARFDAMNTWAVNCLHLSPSVGLSPTRSTITAVGMVSSWPGWFHATGDGNLCKL